MRNEYDAVVVGSGPNGLAAAITLARRKLKVLTLEASDKIGGGARSEYLIDENTYDLCSAVHPLAIASPFFNSLPLNEFGLKWIFPEISLAHPFDDGSAAILHNDISEVQKQFSQESFYYNFFNRLLNSSETLDYFFTPLKIPSSPKSFLKFALNAVRSAKSFSENKIENKKLKSLFIGNAAHSAAKLNSPFTAAAGIFLILLGYKNGWGFPEGGAQKISEVLSSYFKSLGGEIVTNKRISKLDEIPSSKIVLFDLTPKQILKIFNGKLPYWYRKQLERYKYGPGSFKMDFLIDGEIPFTNSDSRKAGTVHLGGDYSEIIDSERKVFEGKIPEKPFVLLAQQSKFDRTRIVAGKNVVWAYCHVPNNSNFDMSEKIENQIERFAPGFKKRIIYKKVTGPEQLQNYNSNYIGGDINGGLFAWNQLITRPAIKLNPYKIPVKGYYICSSSTPPGGGVHGMCGYNAAVTALRDLKIQ